MRKIVSMTVVGFCAAFCVGGCGTMPGNDANATMETGLGRELGQAAGSSLGGRSGYLGSVIGGALGSSAEKTVNAQAGSTSR